ncbi:MAG TPA: hypothetical protein QGF86_06600 [Nitrospinaceae bacterium]|jgi:hypothetical protein|nr:hypothetical protein [Nitrospinaceae bacterium]|tara:strand:- start:67 stop:468 length:402 start_codon:yes stop_codon:yes gene_type:complete
MTKTKKKYQTVELHGWYAWPVCCPFCGQPSFDEGDQCKHVLYVITQGAFGYCSKRFDEVASKAKAPSKVKNPRLLPLVGEFPIEMIEYVDFSENNHIEFHVFDPGDIARVGFACFDDELCGWGRESVDPRVKE